MPATMRHWITARPVTLAGIATAMVTSPPTLVAKPCAPAMRTLFSMTSWIARSTLPRCSVSCVSAATAAGARGPMPSMARLSASRTKPVVSPGVSSWILGRELARDGLLQAHAPIVRSGAQPRVSDDARRREPLAAQAPVAAGARRRARRGRRPPSSTSRLASRPRSVVAATARGRARGPCCSRSSRRSRRAGAVPGDAGRGARLELERVTEREPRDLLPADLARRLACVR